MDHVAGRDPGAFFFQFTDFFAELSEIVFQYVRTHQKNDTRAVDLNNSLSNEVGQITNSKHKIYIEYANCGCNEDNKVFYLLRLSFVSYLHGLSMIFVPSHS